MVAERGRRAGIVDTYLRADGCCPANGTRHWRYVITIFFVNIIFPKVFLPPIIASYDLSSTVLDDAVVADR